MKLILCKINIKKCNENIQMYPVNEQYVFNIKVMCSKILIAWLSIKVNYTKNRNIVIYKFSNEK